MSTDNSKYQPVQPITVNSEEFPALIRLATQVSALSSLSSDEMRTALEYSGVAMPQELLDLAISISIGENHE